MLTDKVKELLKENKEMEEKMKELERRFGISIGFLFSNNENWNLTTEQTQGDLTQMKAQNFLLVQSADYFSELFLHEY